MKISFTLALMLASFVMSIDGREIKIQPETFPGVNGGPFHIPGITNPGGATGGFIPGRFGQPHVRHIPPHFPTIPTLPGSFPTLPGVGAGSHGAGIGGPTLPGTIPTLPGAGAGFHGSGIGGPTLPSTTPTLPGTGAGSSSVGIGSPTLPGAGSHGAGIDGNAPGNGANP